MRYCVVMGETFPKQPLVFTCLQNKSVENTVGIGKFARNEQILLFTQCFLPFLETLSKWKSLKFVLRERVKKGFES